MAATSMNMKPFIIWTLQRTGGTNLAQRLVELSGLKAVQHEPFNKDRVYGQITEQWVQEKDQAKLDKAVDDICRNGVIIKHCVEMMPWEVTKALASAAVKHGYGHIFLYRREPLNRLLSLQFAKLSGIWGPNLKGKNELNEKIFAQPLPVQKLVSHEKQCVGLLSKTWQYLKESGAASLALAYEDIYQTDDPYKPARELLPVLDALGLSRGSKEDSEFVRAIVGEGDQGTRAEYRRFAEIGKLEEALAKTRIFTPDNNTCKVHVLPYGMKTPWVLHAAVDSLPNSGELGQAFDVGGVVVLSPEAPPNCLLRLSRHQEELDIRWGIQSNMMAKQYPQSINSVCARFLAKGIAPLSNGESLKLCLIAPGKQEIPLVEISSIHIG